METRVRLRLAYDGTAYTGWQSNGAGTAVEDRLAAALEVRCGRRLGIVAASRTDAGVHAEGQVVHVDVPAAALRGGAERLAVALNAGLPEDVRVLAADIAPAGFHARFDACGKRYVYHLWNAPVANPLWRGRVWHVPQPLDLAAMRRAAADLCGTHDFRALTSRRAGGPLGDPVRTLRCLRIGRHGARLTLVMEGGGFLYQMCRAIVGTLVEVGRGKRPADGMAALLAAGDRRQAGPNAPACGLCLARVFYPPP